MTTEVEAFSNLSLGGRPLNVMNYSGIATSDLAAQPEVRQLAAQLTRWVENSRTAAGTTSMFNRAAYTPPDNPYDEMRAARHAGRYDSIVAGVGEVTEAFAFQGIKWEGDDADEADAFNQLSRDMNLDAVVRRMWQDEYRYGQCVVAKIWDTVEYTVRGQTKKGNKRKKTYRFYAPTQLKMLDPMKVVPVGTGPIAGELLAWHGTNNEINQYLASVTGLEIDPLQMQFFMGQYNPGLDEQRQLISLGVDPTKLMLMNPEWTFRHTLTKPDYERFADIRLKSCFGILDLKQQLINADRAMLIGAANYILLIRKGTDDLPAQQPEVDNLRAQYNFIAKLPVIISDHRLNIDIIAPKTDFTLDAKKYDLLDSRLLGRLLGTLTDTSHGGRGDNQASLSMPIARLMDNRRHMLRRTLEWEIARSVVRHPRNAGLFDGEPNLVYTPRNVALSMDLAYVQALLALRTQREISRDTILEYFGLDEATEAMRMEMEAEYFDDIFKTQIPFSATGPNAPNPQDPNAQQPPNADAPDKKTSVDPDKPGQQESGKPGNTSPNNTPVAPKVSGGRGGRPVGGGRTPQSPQRQVKPKTSRGNPRTGAAEEGSSDDNDDD